MNDTNIFNFLRNDTLPVFMVISLVLGFILLIFGLVLKGKSKGKSTAGWVCMGIGALSIISNGLQLLMRLV